MHTLRAASTRQRWLETCSVVVGQLTECILCPVPPCPPPLRSQVGTKIGIAFQVAEGGFLDIDVMVCICPCRVSSIVAVSQWERTLRAVACTTCMHVGHGCL
jgi:hypothetical protein